MASGGGTRVASGKHQGGAKLVSGRRRVGIREARGHQGGAKAAQDGITGWKPYGASVMAG
jgi:hypothetical protein|eukprot:CAMPEP_0174288122 /NCGR_PEP_ID=MMETSP0809-20121228/19225_1 /TAXON_ID=73025 ORGANISM="Eutreptiella gymnastica-like, Strain CCMP1594" /NCGR_SAMPLE_ID=MMETSP0809 /ASSEMBLY_ACC=CAM_ASM_000658 /LENGTH=59 /DNA_ID=CAMNT_0015385093 /DNA_START=63 /DNA_END=242 /DNA_ORIENTATION=+